jgi:flavorubredoxin
MVTFETTTATLFSSDAFGSFGALDGGIFDYEIDFDKYKDEICRYYSNIVGKYGNPTQKALEKLGAINIKTIAPSHGPIYRERIAQMIDLYNNWSRMEGTEGVVIAYASMYGNTEDMAETIARSIAENGIKKINIYDVSKTHISFIIADIFKYKGLILGSPTYSNELHPNMEMLVSRINHMGISNRILGVFGSFSWAGAAVKKIKETGEKLGLEILETSVEMKHGLKEDKYEACRQLGREMAIKLKQ